MQPTLPSRDLVLVGAGHTNLHIVRMWRMQPIPDVRLTVVSPFSRATYSGMLPGTLAGLYQPEEMEIDLHRFCVGSGVRLIVAEAVGFDPKKRRVHFDDRPPIRFDVASIGIGSIPNGGDIWRVHPEILSIKPMPTFRQRLIERLEAAENAKPNEELKVCVVGAGAAGVEVTFCLDAFLRKRGTAASLSLVDSGETILPGYAAKTIQLAQAEFDRRGITYVSAARVEKFHAGQLQLADGRSLDADVTIWATRAAPPTALENFDLPKTDDGFLAVRNTLQTTADASVFVVGDTASFVDHPLPKAGVYAVREGPVLWENIGRQFAAKELIPYDPQRGFLSMLATGDGRAITQYKGFSFHGKWVWKWKDHIDRKFMRMFQDYSPMSAEMMQAQSQPTADDGPPVMRCRGCGGKVGANVLAAALERLDIPTSAFVKQGLNPPDDAAILDPKVAMPDVLSVDFFPAFLDDPYLVGRVAALNSLSDLWATGARPLGAMAMVTLPEGAANQQAETLYQLVAGGLRELQAVDAALLGGHTTEGEELIIGYSVVGAMDGLQPFSKGSLQPGDRLILTKPLGTGVLLAAHMQSACPAPAMDAMLTNMLVSNAAAATIAREANLTAITDVTGFGLAGHLLEMLDASHANATIALDALPLLNGFAELSRAGIRSTLDPANRETADRCDLESPATLSQPGYDALFDPQTSGGLLIGIPTESANDFLQRLQTAGYRQAAIIGTITESTTSTPRLSIAQSSSA